MAKYKTDYECPECGIEHLLEFDFYRPEDKDQVEQNVTCSCGCEFLAAVEIEIKYRYMEFQPEIIKSGKG